MGSFSIPDEILVRDIAVIRGGIESDPGASPPLIEAPSLVLPLFLQNAELNPDVLLEQRREFDFAEAGLRLHIQGALRIWDSAQLPLFKSFLTIVRQADPTTIHEWIESRVGKYSVRPCSNPTNPLSPKPSPEETINWIQDRLNQLSSPSTGPTNLITKAEAFYIFAKSSPGYVEELVEAATQYHVTMAAKQEVEEVNLPPLPAGWKGDSPENPNFKKLGTLSPPVMRKIEPAGPHFLAHARRQIKGRTFSEDDRIQALSQVKKVEDDDNGEISEAEDPMMLQRDAKDWRSQDHYAVLGLSKYRWRATDAQIKKAHRKKVLRHHPDKKAAAGQSENDNFFKCIQRAEEQLTDPVKRRQFDSVDELADVEPPTKKQLEKSGAFYKKWRPVFESEARFSNIHPVPQLGDENSTKEEVEAFYDFWYNFSSWRTFEYLDEDVPDDNEGRDHKRHVEKKNANARRKRKNDDVARLRKVVDDCLGFDERIKKFRKEGNAQKNKKKLEKEAALKREAEEKQKAKEAEESKKKADDEAAKVAKEQGKKAKEAAKNAVKKNKRTVKASVKDVNYFATGGEASAKQIDDCLNDTEVVMKGLDPDELAEFVSKLSVAGKDESKVKEAFTSEAGRLIEAGKVKDGELKVFK